MVTSGTEKINIFLLQKVSFFKFHGHGGVFPSCFSFFHLQGGVEPLWEETVSYQKVPHISFDLMDVI